MFNSPNLNNVLNNEKSINNNIISTTTHNYIEFSVLNELWKEKDYYNKYEFKKSNNSSSQQHNYQVLNNNNNNNNTIYSNEKSCFKSKEHHNNENKNKTNYITFSNLNYYNKNHKSLNYNYDVADIWIGYGRPNSNLIYIKYEIKEKDIYENINYINKWTINNNNCNSNYIDNNLNNNINTDNNVNCSSMMVNKTVSVKDLNNNSNYNSIFQNNQISNNSNNTTKGLNNININNNEGLDFDPLDFLGLYDEEKKDDSFNSSSNSKENYEGSNYSKKSKSTVYYKNKNNDEINSRGNNNTMELIQNKYNSEQYNTNNNSLSNFSDAFRMGKLTKNNYINKNLNNKHTQLNKNIISFSNICFSIFSSVDNINKSTYPLNSNKPIKRLPFTKVETPNKIVKCDSKTIECNVKSNINLSLKENVHDNNDVISFKPNTNYSTYINKDLNFNNKTLYTKPKSHKMNNSNINKEIIEHNYNNINYAKPSYFNTNYNYYINKSPEFLHKHINNLNYQGILINKHNYSSLNNNNNEQFNIKNLSSKKSKQKKDMSIINIKNSNIIKLENNAINNNTPTNQDIANNINSGYNSFQTINENTNEMNFPLLHSHWYDVSRGYNNSNMFNNNNINTVNTADMFKSKDYNSINFNTNISNINLCNSSRGEKHMEFRNTISNNTNNKMINFSKEFKK